MPMQIWNSDAVFPRELAWWAHLRRRLPCTGPLAPPPTAPGRSAGSAGLSRHAAHIRNDVLGSRGRGRAEAKYVAKPFGHAAARMPFTRGDGLERIKHFRHKRHLPPVYERHDEPDLAVVNRLRVRQKGKIGHRRERGIQRTHDERKTATPGGSRHRFAWL